jgi:hypothetical protein
MSKLEYTYLVGGVPTDVVSIYLSDTGDDFGLKVKFTDEIIISDGTPMDHVGTGLYSKSFKDPGFDLIYEYSLEVEYPSSSIAFVTGELIGLTLIDDAGSYVSLAEAEDYFSLLLWNSAWEDASELNKEKALIVSSKAIRQLALMTFTTVPQDIKDAVCENAYALLDGKDPEMEFENLTMVNQQYGNIRSTYNRDVSMPHIEAGIVSMTAWRLIEPYLDVSKQLKLSRVS